MKNIIIATALMITNLFYAQNSKEVQKYDIKMPEKVFLNAKKQISTSYTIEDGKTTIYFIVREVVDIPKEVTNAKEFSRWYNEGRVEVFPDYFNEQEIIISNEKALLIITKNDYSFENITYLKLGTKGYIFDYTVSNDESKEIKQTMYAKYYKDYQNFINNIKITKK